VAEYANKIIHIKDGLIESIEELRRIWNEKNFIINFNNFSNFLFY
jgi:radical SAM superfamily enzyme